MEKCKNFPKEKKKLNQLQNQWMNAMNVRLMQGKSIKVVVFFVVERQDSPNRRCDECLNHFTNQKSKSNIIFVMFRYLKVTCDWSNARLCECVRAWVSRPEYFLVENCYINIMKFVRVNKRKNRKEKPFPKSPKYELNAKLKFRSK